MLYFAYGSNMSIFRLKARVPSADPLGCYSLKEHDLRFHKLSRKDHSGKGDAYFTANASDVIYGVLFKINPAEKSRLDAFEGLGKGYEEKTVDVIDQNGSVIKAITYVASNSGIDTTLKPYSWYMNHVLIGAKEASLPVEYIENKISSVEAIEDPDRERDTSERAIYNPR
ncbi:gamma-glutamylcyclotransferase [Pectobacterium carotovorum subsp. carotovorum]|uniref:gamma-glutamylcyclotransferase family protein n=1 Tax=Pectobacterium carotovorum TaxID=554 RepID=UPI0023667C7C|nr:gamma-glutamylcyclotransferase family protein [Pectobacterium carotovorum]WDF99860.1 gamma-glutamylcyclotransferase [Pectobacterium carotovorum subsp. carotovorum]